MLDSYKTLSGMKRVQSDRQQLGAIKRTRFKTGNNLIFLHEKGSKCMEVHVKGHC